jgi:hypothetical protein
VPRFLGKYLKETSATGFLTAVDTEGNPSRTQDLFKMKLLCSSCETILNEAETFFANNVFHPFKNNSLNNIPIDDRLARFAISISLRALWVMQLVEHPVVLNWKNKLAELEAEWKRYLLRKPDAHMGTNSHHILLCNENLLVKGLKESPNLIYSVLRTSAYYIFEKFEKAYIFANLAGVQIISMISPQELPVSRGTEVYPNQTFGTVSPAGIGWGGYYQNLIELTRKCDAALNRISDSYKRKIECEMNKNPDRTFNSEDIRILRMQDMLRHYIQKDME